MVDYLDKMPEGYPGALADEVAKDLYSLSVAGTTPLAFGAAAAYGTLRGTCRPIAAADTIANFAGIVTMTRSAMGDDAYTQYESARLISKGRVWVTTATQPADGAPVFLNPTTGAWSSASAAGNFQIPGARFIRSLSATLAVVELNGVGSYPEPEAVAP